MIWSQLNSLPNFPVFNLFVFDFQLNKSFKFCNKDLIRLMQTHAKHKNDDAFLFCFFFVLHLSFFSFFFFFSCRRFLWNYFVFSIFLVLFVRIWSLSKNPISCIDFQCQNSLFCLFCQNNVLLEDCGPLSRVFLKALNFFSVVFLSGVVWCFWGTMSWPKQISTCVTNCLAARENTQQLGISKLDLQIWKENKSNDNNDDNNHKDDEDEKVWDFSPAWSCFTWKNDKKVC